MSLLPLANGSEEQTWYGATKDQEESTSLIATAPNGENNDVEGNHVSSAYNKNRHKNNNDDDTDNIVYVLFSRHNEDDYDLRVGTKTSPKMSPVPRFQRHRNYYIFHLNQFRHWWKTSRLLVRVSGGYEYCEDEINWTAMGLYKVSKHKQAKKALKSLKKIGRGGPSRDFLKIVKPFTRTIRLVLAVARGLEASVDNRLTEVLLAEACAFMGNRCSRWIARELVSIISSNVMFPYVGALLLEPNLDQHSRPIIVMMGFIRSILPFAFSFQGSRFGRQVTYNTYKYALFRWKPVQSLKHFHQNAGVYQDTVLDPELQELAHNVAEAIGHGLNPILTRQNMFKLGFHIIACGQGGLSVYEQEVNDSGKVLRIHVTPYGPGILDEIPRYIVLERKTSFSSFSIQKTSNNTLNETDAIICGFTYSGAFFKSQEWAALTARYNETLQFYENACKALGTVKSNKNMDTLPTPPTDLVTLKAFIRSGHSPKKIRKDKKRWKQLDAEISILSSLVTKYQNDGKAPKKIILYLEGLDCSAKSSTGGLIFTALEKCGYEVRIAQHNRPPDAEQRQKPWMDRGRFEYPDDVYSKDEKIPSHSALVWDRGPGGDFVYGNLSQLDEATKKLKYDEFRTYDAQCRKDGVLFCKLFFVADKDSIAKTLGKRLAHKKIARELRVWLDSNSIPHARKGLDEIENHIDPTDFVAFNKYKTNISIFTDFARNTDNIQEQVLVDGTKPGYHNPWCVVNTAKRHPARLGLLRTFELQLKRFARNPNHPPPLMKRLQRKLSFSLPYLRDDAVFRLVVEDKKDIALSIRAMIQILILILLVIFYLYTTWKVDVLSVFDD